MIKKQLEKHLNNLFNEELCPHALVKRAQVSFANKTYDECVQLTERFIKLVYSMGYQQGADDVIEVHRKEKAKWQTHSNVDKKDQL
ncbi:hypothetical protein [Priestia megaterium]|uniref:hypothetical protein n=1 Tax=Priestia megaterium TaxID=1404 RepID=UPI0027962167|nr:hypothetical protein [Priestia megaterium]